MTLGTCTIKTSRGSALTYRRWPKEAPLNMLMSNLYQDIAERPDDLIAYGAANKTAHTLEEFGG